MQNNRYDQLISKAFIILSIFIASIGCKNNSSLKHSPFPFNTDSNNSQQVLNIIFEDVEISMGDYGIAKFSGKELQYLNQSGEPELPYKVLKAVLPPDAVLSSINIKLENEVYEDLNNKWEVLPKPAIIYSRIKNITPIWPKGKTIINGKDISIYQNDAFYPENNLKFWKTGQMRKWKVVDIPISLFQYNPVTKLLKRLIKSDVVISFNMDEDEVKGSIINRIYSKLNINNEKTIYSDTIGTDRIKNTAINFKEVEPEYQSLQNKDTDSIRKSGSGNQKNSYVIITTTTIKNSSTKLATFVANKRKRYDVYIITEDSWGGGTGNAASENIRNWLKNNYINLRIEYVLLIGNPNPDNGDVPMKMLWPCRFCNNLPSFSPPQGFHDWQSTASDYYYADLTGNWDIDGDGFYGEWPQDTPLQQVHGDILPGGVDTNYEVVVGRIPVYNFQISTLDKILSKIVNYENELQYKTGWRHNALLAGKILGPYTSGAELGETIKDTILIPNQWGYHRIYDVNDKFGVPPETKPWTMDNFINVIKSNSFGLVAWYAHGWDDSVGGLDGTTIMNSNHAKNCDNTFPYFTFQASCLNAAPFYNNNLAYSLLSNGAINTIGGTSLTWSTVINDDYWGISNPVIGTPSDPGIGYEYTKRLVINKMTSGYALQDLKEKIFPVGAIYLQNYFAYNIYGDPELGLFSYIPTYNTPCEIPAELNGGIELNCCR